MLKLLTTIALSSSLSFSAELLTESYILEFLKKSLSSNKAYELQNVTLHSVKMIDFPSDWFAYFITLHVSVGNKTAALKDVIFYRDSVLTRDFTTIEDGKSLKSELLKNWDENIKESIK